MAAIANSPSLRQRKALFVRLLKAYLLLNGIRWGLLCLRFPRLRRLVEHLAQKQQPAQVRLSPGGARYIAAVVEAVAVYSPGTVKCLAKALTTQILLRRHGCAPQLQVGVARSEAGLFEAHAWVELAGEVVMGQLPDLDRYKPLPSLERSAP